MEMKILIGPMLDPAKVSNTYMLNLIDNISKFFTIVNKEDYTKIGVFYLYKYFFKSKIFYLNWPEDIVNRRFGNFQMVFFFIFVLLAKIFKKKIIWTHHNLKSHIKSKFLGILANQLLRYYSDIIIIHTKLSIDILNVDDKKLLYYPHPTYGNFIENKNDLIKDIDILLWGSVQPYKGFYEFLKYCFENFQSSKLKIVIAGKFSEQTYFNKINSLNMPNLKIINEFIDITKLEELHLRAKNIVFPYKNETVLNSGAVIFSIRFKANIWGPAHGSFLELTKLGLIRCYKNFKDIKIDREFIIDETILLNRIKYINEFTWLNFAKNVKEKLTLIR